MRDDFTQKTKETLARRVGFRCSNPNCSKLTTGPNKDALKATNIGVAAHVTAASKGGYRYNHDLTPEQRKDIDNGIWLCQTCSVLIDRDLKYTEVFLREWKNQAEKKAGIEISTASSSSRTTFDGFSFDNKLEASWAMFFKSMNWHYTYKPFSENEYIWQPSFQIKVSSGKEFLVDVGLKKNFTRDKRLKIGNATNYSEDILALFENPFSQDEFQYCTNRIGFVSCKGKIKNAKKEDDFEFCVAVVSNLLYEISHSIYNLCTLKEPFREMLLKTENYCLEKWRKSSNQFK